MENRKTCFKSSGASVWIFQVFTIQLALQVLRCSGHDKLPGDAGSLEYNESNQNYNPHGLSEAYKISGLNKDQSKDIDYLMGYEFKEPEGIYKNKDMELFKRSAKGDRAKEKLRRMIKRNRLYHKGRLSIKNGSAVGDYIVVEQPKQFNRGSSYIEGKHEFGKDSTYKKTSLISNDKQHITKNGHTQTKLHADFNVSNTSNNKNKNLPKFDPPLIIEDGITSQSIKVEDENKDISGNSFYREIKKDESSKKNTKRPYGKNKKENKELKEKSGFTLPIKKALRKKLKSKMRKISENANYENTNNRIDKVHFSDGKCSLNKHLDSKIKPGEVQSYGLDGNFKNISLINHGFLKAFEKRYDNHLNETKPNNVLKGKALRFSDTSYENYTGFEDRSKKIKANDWKKWSGFNVGDYYEPLILFNDKAHFDSQSPTIQDHHFPKKAVHGLRKATSVKKIENQEIESEPLVESDNYILKSNNGKNEHHKKKRYMFSGKTKHKGHPITVDSGKKRGARDINSRIRKNNIYYGSVLHQDNEGFDYDENKDIDDEIYNINNDNEMPGLVLDEQGEKGRDRETFHRLKKDDSFLKKSRANKSKEKAENIDVANENKFKKSSSRKDLEFNGDENESSDVCVGYKCDDILNTTETLTTAYISASTVTTKRNNNGKSKQLSKSKKTNVESKNSTNLLNEIDEHSIFLCGQLADDFVKAVFTKIKRSRKILKELGFGNETEQSCSRCIETKANKLPDLESVKGTLGKCSTQSDVKNKNSKCYTVPDPMESFINLLLSLGKEDEDSGHNRFRDDSSFIFNRDDFESFTKNENGAAINDKYLEGRESVNKDLFEKLHPREEDDEENIGGGGSNSRKNSLEENDQNDLSKDNLGEVYQSIDEELKSKTKSSKNIDVNRLQQDFREPQPFQSEENLKGNDLIDVFERQDSQTSARHKYQTHQELKNDKNNNKNLKLKAMPQVSNIDYSDEEFVNNYPFSQISKKKNIYYLNNKPSKALLDQEEPNMQSINVLGNRRQQNYQRDYLQRPAVNYEPQKLNIHPIETRIGFPGTEVNRFGDNYKYPHNPQNKLIQSKIMTQNSNRYVGDSLSEDAVGNNIGSMEYQLFPGQMKEGGHDRSYNAMPFYVDNQRMDKRETPTDTNEEEVIFFELPNVEYDLY